MPAVARAGDSVMSQDGTGYKCRQPMQTSVGEVCDKVKADGIFVVIVGKKISPHPKSGCSLDESTLSSGSGKVHVQGKPVGRIGDDYGGINTITAGSSKVMAGG